MTPCKKLINLTLMGALALSLVGCVPAAVVGGATVGGSLIYNKRSIKTMVRDQQVSTTVQNTIKRNPQISKQVHINATTYNGVVLLSGEALNAQARDAAYQDASKVNGIRLIYNEVTVGKLAGFRTRMRASLLKSQVKAALLAKPGVSSTQIKVATAQRTVYLMGMVSHTQGALAASVASRVSGVKKVVKVFEYTN